MLTTALTPVEVVKQQRTMAHTNQQVQGLGGTKPGVPLPLLIDGDVVGTVGISGSPRQVQRFGR